MVRRLLFLAPVLGAPLLWAANFTVARAVHAISDPIWLNSARWSIAALALAPLLWRDRYEVLAVLRARPGILVALALLGVVGSNTLVTCALQVGGATEIGVVYGLTPFLILLFARLSGDTGAERGQGRGAALAFGGVCLILMQQGEGVALNPGRLGAAGLVLAGGVLWALYTVIMRRACVPLRPMTLVALLAAIGALLMVPLLWLRPGPAPGGMAQVLGAAGFLGIGGSALAFWFWSLAVARLGPGRAGIGLQTIPVFSALLAWAFLGEVPGFVHIAGIVLVVTGLCQAFRPTLGRAHPACLKTRATTGHSDARRDYFPQDRRNGYLGRTQP